MKWGSSKSRFITISMKQKEVAASNGKGNVKAFESSKGGVGEEEEIMNTAGKSDWKRAFGIKWFSVLTSRAKLEKSAEKARWEVE